MDVNMDTLDTMKEANKTVNRLTFIDSTSHLTLGPGPQGNNQSPHVYTRKFTRYRYAQVVSLSVCVCVYVCVYVF